MSSSRPPYETPLVVAAFIAAATGLAWALGCSPGAPEARSTPPVETRATPASSGESAPPGVPHTELPLRLLATILRENSALSLATVEDLDRTAHQVLSEGQGFRAHPRVRVARIERRRILIDNDGVREQLVIDHSDRAPLELSDEPTREPTRSEVEPSRDMLAKGEVSAVYQDGEMIGVQLDDIRPGGIYEQIGLRNGDIVTTINGVSLAEPTAAAEVLAEIARSDELSVAVERGDGSQETLSFPTADLTSAVQQLER